MIFSLQAVIMEGYIVISSILAFSIFLTQLGAYSDAQLIINSCATWMKCSYVPDITYGLVDGTCHVYQNPCLLAIENCDRKARNETLITPSTKELCTPYCASICETIVSPVCGEYRGQMTTFFNECDMNRYNCQNGAAFFLYNDGPCN